MCAEAELKVGGSPSKESGGEAEGGGGVSSAPPSGERQELQPQRMAAPSRLGASTPTQPLASAFILSHKEQREKEEDTC